MGYERRKIENEKNNHILIYMSPLRGPNYFGTFDTTIKISLFYRHCHDGSNLGRHGESFSHSHTLVGVNIEGVHLDGNVVLEGRLKRISVHFNYIW